MEEEILFFPRGALQSVEDLALAWLQPLYFVDAVGKNSTLHTRIPLSKEPIRHLGELPVFKFWALHPNLDDGGYISETVVSDYNIEVEDRYNNNYIFYNEDDALNYMLWASDKTDDTPVEEWYIPDQELE